MVRTDGTIGTMVPWYTYTMVRTHVYVPWYTRVPYHWYGTMVRVPWYHGIWYTCTKLVPWFLRYAIMLYLYVRTYTCTYHGTSTMVRAQYTWTIWCHTGTTRVRTRVLRVRTYCRHRCRVGASTVVYRDAFYHGTSMLTTPTSVPVAPECLYFKLFLR